MPRGGCWIREEDLRIYEKSKLLSFISSNKTLKGWAAIGHGFRQDLYGILTRKGGFLGSELKRSGVRDELGLYGRITGTNLPYKLPSLADYAFQIAVENMIHDNYFTEKVIDCFATGTIPIYRGTRQICRYFDPRGILFFDGMEDLVQLLTSLTMDDYYDRLEAVRSNFERIRDFLVMEHWMLRHTDLAET